MKRYLLDTNHLSAYLDGQPGPEDRIENALRRGDRVGVCLPVLCEYRAGIRGSKHFRRNLAKLQSALTVLRVWQIDEQTIAEFGELFWEVRAVGRHLAQFDMLIAGVARRNKMTLLSGDQDFNGVKGVKLENWL